MNYRSLFAFAAILALTIVTGTLPVYAEEEPEAGSAREAIGNFALKVVKSDTSKDIGKILMKRSIEIANEWADRQLGTESDGGGDDSDRKGKGNKKKGKGPAAHSAAWENSAVWGNKAREDLGGYVQKQIKDGVKGDALADSIRTWVSRLEKVKSEVTGDDEGDKKGKSGGGGKDDDDDGRGNKGGKGGKGGKGNKH